jgi:hypothetical protein
MEMRFTGLIADMPSLPGFLTKSSQRLVADEEQAFSAQVTERGPGETNRLAHATVEKVPPHVLFSFCIISADGALHPPCIDANGFFTLLRILHGCKLVVFGSPSVARPSTLPHLQDSWEFLQDPTLVRGAVLLQRRDVLCVDLSCLGSLTETVLKHYAPSDSSRGGHGALERQAVTITNGRCSFRLCASSGAYSWQPDRVLRLLDAMVPCEP